MVTFRSRKFANMVQECIEATSVRRVASACNVNPTTIFRIAKGIKQPTMDELCRICTGLSVDPTQYFDVRMFTEKMI